MNDRADPFTAVLDANVLAGGLTRNLLLTFAEAGFYRPRFSAEILDEVEKYIVTRTDAATGQRQRANIERAFPEAIVEGYEPLVDGLILPDKKDRHVLASAIQTRAAVIVTDNLKDFPEDVLSKHNVETVSLDNFLADIIDLAGPEAIVAARRMRRRLNSPEIDAEELIRLVEKRGLLQAADLLSRYHELL